MASSHRSLKLSFRNLLCFVVFVILLLPRAALSASSEKPSDVDFLLAKAQSLIDVASKSPRSSVLAVPLYDEPLRLLDEITNAKSYTLVVRAQAEKLKAFCYDRQARYAEKNGAMQRYCVSAFSGDKEKAATVLSTQADGLLEAKETTEAISSYRLTVSGYSDTRVAAESLFRVATVIESEEAKRYGFREAIAEYERLLADYPSCKYWRDAALAVARTYWEVPGGQRSAIDTLQALLLRHPDDRQEEAALWLLGWWYSKSGDMQKGTEALRTYVGKYPGGEHAKLASLVIDLSATLRK